MIVSNYGVSSIVEITRTKHEKHKIDMPDAKYNAKENLSVFWED